MIVTPPGGSWPRLLGCGSARQRICFHGPRAGRGSLEARAGRAAAVGLPAGAEASDDPLADEIALRRLGASAPPSGLTCFAEARSPWTPAPTPDRSAAPPRCPSC